MTEGIIYIKDSSIIIKLADGTAHIITADDYVEVLQNFNEDWIQFLPLHQEQADGLWYFDSIGVNNGNNGLPARFRKAQPGERRKRGILTLKKGKLFIELWDDTTQEIKSGSHLELNLPRARTREDEANENHVVRGTWQRVHVESESGKWIYIDMYGHSHALTLKNEQFARITV